MNCGDCDCKEGELHNYFPNCDMEKCPICKGQLLSCGCHDDKMSDEIREPYFQEVFCCERCGKTMPDLVMVPDEEWKFIYGITYPLDCILCLKCMKFIKNKREKK